MKTRRPLNEAERDAQRNAKIHCFPGWFPSRADGTPDPFGPFCTLPGWYEGNTLQEIPRNTNLEPMGDFTQLYPMAFGKARTESKADGSFTHTFSEPEELGCSADLDMLCTDTARDYYGQYPEDSTAANLANLKEAHIRVGHALAGVARAFVREKVLRLLPARKP